MACEYCKVTLSSPYTVFSCNHAFHSSCVLLFPNSSECIKCSLVSDRSNGTAESFLFDITPLRLTMGNVKSEDRKRNIKAILIMLSGSNVSCKVDADKILAKLSASSGSVKYRGKISREEDYEYDEDSDSSGGGVMRKITGMFTRDMKVDHDLYLKNSPEQLLDKGVEIITLVECNVTMSALRERGVNAHGMLKKGYGLLAWVCLSASWQDLMKMGLNHSVITDFPELVPMEELIMVYSLKFKNVYEDLCNRSVDNLCGLNMTVEHFKRMQPDLLYFRNLKLDCNQEAKNKFWGILKKKEWKAININLEEYVEQKEEKEERRKERSSRNRHS